MFNTAPVFVRIAVGRRARSRQPSTLRVDPPKLKLVASEQPRQLYTFGERCIVYNSGATCAPLRVGKFDGVKTCGEARCGMKGISTTKL